MYRGMGSRMSSDFRASRNYPIQRDDGTYDLTFKDSILGIKKEFEITYFEPCSICSGSGSKLSTKPDITWTIRVMAKKEIPYPEKKNIKGDQLVRV